MSPGDNVLDMAHTRTCVPDPAELRVKTSQCLILWAMLVFSAMVCAGSEITLESGSTLTISETEYNRYLPHAFYDQAVSSLARLFPEHVLLATRRTGKLGRISYSLVCFKETRSGSRVVIQGVAVLEDRAWTFDATAPSEYGDTLLQVLEQIAKLTSS